MRLLVIYILLFLLLFLVNCLLMWTAFLSISIMSILILEGSVHLLPREEDVLLKPS